ncbi:putative membrane protein [Waddlia chondrophila 2032/99]|uniref:Putative membrane protein n=2 Tax=Waddlia chondrophila TaxID=71667 RepID=D6YU92_WADCW|nr:hypothetical protein [Waddlia chondrophila]ADI37703.1 putative membrane protein [Waddlia chondrophila WSU 86-1044]CCB90953.1 putative membrane protein [Waddlia chondrophila 2032/99]
MRNPLTVLILLIFAGAVVNHFVYKHEEKIDRLETLKKAYSGYVEGESAESLDEREKAFNQSLKNYIDLERDDQPEYGNGKLYFDIGNAYFQLGNYPFAVLYYYKALKLMPREDIVGRNLSTALNKLGIGEKKKETVFQNLFFFHFYLSVPERLQLFTLFAFAAFFLFSVFIWLRKELFKTVGKIAAFAAFLFFASFLYSHYLSPIEAVIVKSSDLYRDSGFQYAKVQEEPILSGNKVEVLDVIDQGAWLKIRLQGGELGYVPQEAVRII